PRVHQDARGRGQAMRSGGGSGEAGSPRVDRIPQGEAIGDGPESRHSLAAPPEGAHPGRPSNPDRRRVERDALPAGEVRRGLASTDRIGMARTSIKWNRKVETNGHYPT